MKTSNKLLIGMYFFIVILIFSSFFIANRNAKDFRYESSRESLAFNKKIDSLVLNINDYSNVKISKGDSFIVNYVKGYKFSSNQINKSLYIDCMASLEIEIPDSISYIYVFANESQLYGFNQDSLSLFGLGLNRFSLIDSEIKALNINLNTSKFYLKNTNVERLNVDLKDESIFQLNNSSNIFQINGIADSTSSINISRVKMINQENKSDKIHILTTKN